MSLARFKIIVLLALLLLWPAMTLAQKTEPALPQGFVYVAEVAPEILQDMRYCGHNNFTGGPVPGYEAPTAILSHKAAMALKAVNDDCLALGYVVKVFDAYRPQRAVDYFIAWSQTPETGSAKAAFYPNIDKAQLFKQGYLARKSGHSRGGTVDLTLADKDSGVELDMGSPFDYLDPRSHFDAGHLNAEQIYNRNLLRTLMEKHGFEPYNKEWWHFTLKDEPFPQTYFDFEVR